MMANFIYLTTLLIFIFICITPLFKLKTLRERGIEEYKEEISGLLNQKIIKLDTGFENYSGETKQWQEDFNQKILEINNRFRRASSASVNSSSFDRIVKQMQEVKRSVDELISSEKRLHIYKKEVVQYLAELRVTMIGDPDETLKHHLEVLSALIESDPIGSYNTMLVLRRINTQKKKKNAG